MKNYIKLLLVVFAMPIAFSSCKDDDDNGGASIIGTWEETSFVASGCTDSDDNESSTCSSGCDQIVVTATTVTIGGTANPYTVSGNTITVTFGSDSETVTFTVNETTLVIMGTGDGCSTVTTYKRVS